MRRNFYEDKSIKVPEDKNAEVTSKEDESVGSSKKIKIKRKKNVHNTDRQKQE